MNTLFLSGNHTDFFVSFGDNITDQIIRTFYVFHYHRRNLLTACKPVGNHCGNGKVFGNDVDQALMGSHVDDSLYLLCKKLLDFLPHNFLVAVVTIIFILEFLIKAKIYKEDLVIFFLAVFCNSINNIRKGKDCHILCNDTNASGVLGFQILGHVVWSVVHFTDYLLYTLPGGVTNTAFMIDNIGNCGNRYVAGFCNFFYGRHGNLLPFFLLY